MGEWVRVAEMGDIDEETVIGVIVGDRQLAVYHLAGGEFRVTDNVCTHEHVLLSEGWLDGTTIECPLHGGAFDVRTGKGLCAPIERDLAVYEVETRDGGVFVRIAD
jgi:nitrite reductase/ring-hydroxylating ferredoxin subunit